MFNPEFLKERGFDELDDISEIYPLHGKRSAWEKITASSADFDFDELEDDGIDPSAPRNIRHQGDKIVWEKRNNRLIFGYYIYEATEDGKDFQKIDRTAKTKSSK